MKSKTDYPSVKLSSETNLSTSLLQDPFQIILLQTLKLQHEKVTEMDTQTGKAYL